MYFYERPKNFKEIVMDIFNNPNNNEITEYSDLESDLILFDLIDDNTAYCNCCYQQMSISNIYRHFVSEKHNTAKLLFFIKRNAEIHNRLKKQMNEIHKAMRINFDKKIKGEISYDEFVKNMSEIRKLSELVTG